MYRELSLPLPKTNHKHNKQPMTEDVLSCHHRNPTDTWFSIHTGQRIFTVILLFRNYMNDSLRTDIFLRFTPETIACACIDLAARALQVRANLIVTIARSLLLDCSTEKSTMVCYIRCTARRDRLYYGIDSSFVQTSTGNGRREELRAKCDLLFCREHWMNWRNSSIVFVRNERMKGRNCGRRWFLKENWEAIHHRNKSRKTRSHQQWSTQPLLPLFSKMVVELAFEMMI